jgi:hypothetical protein
MQTDKCRNKKPVSRESSNKTRRRRPIDSAKSTADQEFQMQWVETNMPVQVTNIWTPFLLLLLLPHPPVAVETA